jgi:hypothetical protein
MITDDKIAQTICKAYRDAVGDTAEVPSPDTISMSDLYDLGRRHAVGDTLFDWMAIEAKEGGELEDGRIDIGSVIRVLERGRDNLQTIIAALWQLDHQDPDRESCFMCGGRFDKGTGHTIETHGAYVNVCDQCNDGWEKLKKGKPL